MNERIYRVDMANLSYKIEDVPSEYLHLGGRALTSSIVAKEVPPTCHPLGKNNKLVFAPGMLSGTIAANSGRNSVGAKSPLTGGIKESNVGGTSARIFANLGIKALIIENIPQEDKFYHLHITKEKVEFLDATEYVGHENYYVLDKILEKFNKKVAVMSIGTAGERRMNLANISVKDPQGKLRSHGRGAMGAVMGSKKIKCISVDSESFKEVSIEDNDKFRSASKIFTQALKKNPISGEGLLAFGTNVLVNIINEAGALPTRNFRSGNFKFAENISGESMAENIKARDGKTTHGCHAGCIIQCSQVYPDKDKSYLTSGFEYESIWAFGAHLGINDLDEIAKIDALMDDLGLDSIETGVALGVAVDAGILEYGDSKKAYDLIANDIKNATPIGRIIGAGTDVLGKIYSLVRVPTVKGQGIPAYEPRAVKGQGVTYATSTMGADHTAGYAVATNILNSGGFIDPLKKEGQIELSRNLQIATAAVDSTGMCIFTAFPLLDEEGAMQALVDMVNARFGTKISIDEFANLGKKVLLIERDFNQKAGLNNAHDRLPEFMTYEPLPPHNVIWDFSDEELDGLWNFA